MVQGQRLSHTMDPARGAPLRGAPALVCVVAQTCAEADGWATALMAKGALEGAALARRLGLGALILERDGDQLRETRIGWPFEGLPGQGRPATARAGEGR
jgi:thiamine biosynthesis lipoprotein